MRKKKSRGSTVIDLTPLLDVIFIVLLVVICHMQIDMEEKKQQDTSAQNEISQLTEANESLTAQLGTAEQQLEKYNNMSDYLTMVTVYITYNDSDLKNRQILLKVDSAETQTLAQVSGSDKTPFVKLRESLEEVIESASGKPVILSVDTEKLLYRDEQEFESIVLNLNETYENLYMSVRSGQDKE